MPEFGRNMNGDILGQPRNFFNITTALLMQEAQVGSRCPGLGPGQDRAERDIFHLSKK